VADFSTLKKKSKFGPPPSANDVRDNLALPESHENEQNNLIDGRSLRKTGRTHQLATRVTYDFYREVKQLSLDENIKIAELLERAIRLYQNSK
jgi:hypothetical protein